MTRPRRLPRPKKWDIQRTGFPLLCVRTRCETKGCYELQIYHHQPALALCRALRRAGRFFSCLHHPGAPACTGSLRHHRAGHGFHQYPAGLCGQRHGHRPDPEKRRRRPGLFLRFLFQHRRLPGAVRGAFSGRPFHRAVLWRPGPDGAGAGAEPDGRCLGRAQHPAIVCVAASAVQAVFLFDDRQHACLRRGRHRNGVCRVRRLGAGGAVAVQRRHRHHHPVGHGALAAQADVLLAAAEGPAFLWLETAGLLAAGHRLQQPAQPHHRQAVFLG